MNPNDCAFPAGNHEGHQPESGLTKREYFASAALQRMVDATMGDQYCTHAAIMAVKFADALIKALDSEEVAGE